MDQGILSFLYIQHFIGCVDDTKEPPGSILRFLHSQYIPGDRHILRTNSESDPAYSNTLKLFSVY